MAIEIELNGNSIQFTLLNQVELIISSYTFEHLSCYDANIALNTSATDDLSWKAQLGRSKESETEETWTTTLATQNFQRRVAPTLNISSN